MFAEKTRIGVDRPFDESLARNIEFDSRYDEELGKREEQLGFLLSLSDALRSLSDPVEIHDVVTHKVMAYFGADRCHYCEIENDHFIIRRDAFSGDLSSVVGTYPLSNNPIYKNLFRTGEPIIIPNVKTVKLMDENLRQFYMERQIISFINIPVIKDSKAVGMLCITQSRPRKWTESQVALAQDIAQRVWEAVERARTEEELRIARSYLEEKVAARTKELYLERQRLYEVLDNLPIAISVLESDYTVSFANRNYRERYGNPEGRPCYEFVFDFDRPCEKCESLLPLKTGQPHHWTSITTDNRIFEVHNFPFKDDNGTIKVLEMNMEIAGKKKLEAEMARLDRLHLIGRMAASIAHEIRNPMTAVRGLLQVLGEKPAYHEDQEFFDIMITELDRVNEIISEFLGLARDRVVNLTPHSLDRIVQSLYPMMMSNANLGEVEIVLELSNPPQVLMDKNEIRQLILNMFTNAIEAMPNHGKITIGTIRKDNEAVLFIKDEGTGLPPEIINNLGTPFVSTKENGLGLGLAVCYSIAARHHARIDFETGPKGTVFYISFPYQLPEGRGW